MAVNLSLFAGAGAQFFDDNGVPLAGGLIYTYLAGTTTATTTYTSSTGLIAHANPIVLNAAGRIATGEIWITVGLAYKFILKNSSGVQIGSYDNIPSYLTMDAANVTYNQGGTNAVTTTVQAKLQESVSVKDFGAVGNGVANDSAAFTAAGSSAAKVQVLIPAGVYNLTTSPAPTGAVTWVVEKGASFTGAGKLSTVSNKLINYGSFKSIESDPAYYNGIFGYLEDNAAITAYGNLGVHGSVQSAGGAGISGESFIGVSTFAAHNAPSSFSDVWGFYCTVLREATAGVTTGMELDVANMGSTVILFPNGPFVTGSTTGISICSGGEVTVPSAGGSPGVASVALSITQNDSQVVKTAKFEKGILFHSQAILGTDGATGSGNAIAFATGHAMTWFNNSNQAIAEIVVNKRSFGNNFRMDFSEFGVLFQDRVSSQTVFQIAPITNAVNFLQVNGSATGNAVSVVAAGNDTNIDFGIQTKGTAYVDFRGASIPVTAGAAAGYLAVKVNGTRYNIPLYLP